MMEKLIELMLKNLTLRGASGKTREAYIRVVKKFCEYFSALPDELSTKHVKDYLFYLINEEKRSPRTIGVTLAAFKFLYIECLERPEVMVPIPNIKQDKKLPVVLNPEEIQAIIDAADNLKHKALLVTIYSAGLRTTEAAQLRVQDIDSKRMQIRVHNSKGAKDRYTILSETALEILRKYWKQYRPEFWLFPGKWKNKPITQRRVSQMFQRYKEEAGIKKQVTTHSLRHSFATHLLENGVNLHHIQLLLGHSSPQATTVYLHVKRTDLQKITSPLD